MVHPTIVTSAAEPRDKYALKAVYLSDVKEGHVSLTARKDEHEQVTSLNAAWRTAAVM